MNLKSRIEKLEKEASPLKPWKKVTVDSSSDDVKALMHEQLEQGETTTDFNWIVRRIADPV